MTKNQLWWTLGCGLGALGIGIALAHWLKPEESAKAAPAGSEEDDYVEPPVVAVADLLAELAAHPEASEAAPAQAPASPAVSSPEPTVPDAEASPKAATMDMVPDEEDPPTEAETVAQRAKVAPESVTLPEEVSIPQSHSEPTADRIPLDDRFPLQLGSQGPRVVRLKVWLMRNYGGVGEIDDQFDTCTQARVERFLKVSEVSKKLFNRHRMGKHVQQQNPIR